jgi:hypothetical protein
VIAARWLPILLLLLSALPALPGGAGSLPFAGAGVFAGCASAAGPSDVVEPLAQPESPDRVALVRSSRWSAGPRPTGEGPSTHRTRHGDPGLARFPLPGAISAAAIASPPDRYGLSALDDGPPARAGARSAYATTLPPPLPA